LLEYATLPALPVEHGIETQVLPLQEYKLDGEETYATDPPSAAVHAGSPATVSAWNEIV
jgi:hypothetical protein